MGGVVQSNYECGLSEFETFVSQLKNSGYFIEDETSGSGEEWFFDLRFSQGYEWGVFLSACKVGNDKVSISMNWPSKDSGAKPFLSQDMAMVMEKMLLGVGATEFEKPKVRS